VQGSNFPALLRNTTNTKPAGRLAAMSFVTQQNPWALGGTLAQRPSPDHLEEGYTYFAWDTLVLYWLKIDPITHVRTWEAAGGGGGGPPLSNDPPQNIGTTAPGISPDASRADHVHAHGVQPLGTGTDHALVTPDPGGVAGFMSPADKAALDALIASISPPPLFLYVPGVALNDVVTIVAPDKVGKANATSMATMPAVGVVTSFPDPLHCTIVMVGARGGFVGLVPGTSYYVDNAVPGGITSDVSSGPGPFVLGNVIQKVGVAINPTTMLVAMGSEDLVKL